MTMTGILLLQLPVDILITIFLKLDLEDIRNLILTCKTVKNIIINDNSIWRSAYRERLTIHDVGKNNMSTRSWHNRCRISHNWCKGIYKSKVLILHHTNYMPWIKFHNSEALLLTVGSELHCFPVDKYGLPNCKNLQWKLNMPKVERNDVRTDDISRFILKDNLLVCGNRNGSTAVYKLDNIKFRPLLIQYIRDCHQNGQVEVSAVEICDNGRSSYMVTASDDCSHLLFWTWDSGNELNCLSYGGQNTANYMDIELNCYDGVRSLAINQMGDKLAIGPNGNSKPLMIDVNTASFLITSEESKNIKQIVRDIQWHDDNTICYVTHSGLLQLIDIRNNEVVYKVKDPFQSTLYCVKTDKHNAIVVGSSEYSRCVLFDVRYPHHAQLYFTQKKASPVYSLDFDSTKLIAAVDRSVTALNFNVSAATVHKRDYSHIFHTCPQP